MGGDSSLTHLSLLLRAMRGRETPRLSTASGSAVLRITGSVSTGKLPPTPGARAVGLFRMRDCPKATDRRTKLRDALHSGEVHTLYTVRRGRRLPDELAAGGAVTDRSTQVRLLDLDDAWDTNRCHRQR